MSLSVPVLTAISQPLSIVGASWKATAMNFGFAVVTLLFLGNVWSVFMGFVVFQLLAIYLTYQDYHFVEVMMAVLKYRKTPMLISQKGHRYVG